MKKLIILIATLIFSMSLFCACNPYDDFYEGEYVFDLASALENKDYLTDSEDSTIECNTTLCGRQVNYISLHLTELSLIDYKKQKPLNVMKVSTRYAVDLRIRFADEDTPTHYDITFVHECHGECVSNAVINNEEVMFFIGPINNSFEPPKVALVWQSSSCSSSILYLYLK